MPTYAHIETGHALDVWRNDSLEEYAARFPHHPENWDIAVVDAGTVHGATPDGHGGWDNPVVHVPIPTPNTPNNPFFGKEIVPGGQFLGVILGVLGFARANRLMNDSHFTAAKAFLTAQSVLVNPDDKQGQFLGLVQFVTTTNGDDGAVLVTAQEIAGIRAAMK